MASPTRQESWRQTCERKIQHLKSLHYTNSQRLHPHTPHELQEEFQASKFLEPDLIQSIHSRDVFEFLSELEKTMIDNVMSLDKVVSLTTRAGNTILHISASLGCLDILDLITHHFPQLITTKNMKGDTVLHVGARTLSPMLIKIVITCYARHFADDFYPKSEEGLMKVRNKYGNTALHEAVVTGNVDGVELLYNADGVVVHFLNKEGKSPLYLAVESGNNEIVNTLLGASFKNRERHQGNSPLHAAILTMSSGDETNENIVYYSQPLLEGWLVDEETPNLDPHLRECLEQEIQAPNKDLLDELIAKRPELIYLRDQNGGTPLHCAASIGHLEAVRKIVNAIPLSTLEWNSKGYLPIHVACKKGHLNVVIELVQRKGFDPMDSLTQDGQNVLHIATKSGRDNVVKYMLKERKLGNLLNKKDNDGNTPLHLASMYLHPKILLLLTQEKRLKINIANNDGFTARDVILLRRNTPPTFRELLSFAILKSIGTPLSDKGRRARRSQRSPPKLKWIKDRISIILLVAILIATVTFAAGFTMPGGIYYSDNKDTYKNGMATLLDRKMFQVFTICDAIAMYSSTMGSFLLLWAQLGDFHVAFRATYFALYMVGLALVTMSIAFMAAIHLVVSNLSWLSDIVMIVGIIFVLMFLGVYVVLLFPLGARHRLLPPHLSTFIFKMMISFSGSYGKSSDNGKVIKKVKRIEEIEKDKHKKDKAREDPPKDDDDPQRHSGRKILVRNKTI